MQSLGVERSEFVFLHLNGLTLSKTTKASGDKHWKHHYLHTAVMEAIRPVWRRPCQDIDANKVSS